MENILQEAERIVNGPRASDYGDARENHQRIADIWSAVLGAKVTPEQVVMCMIGVKLARLANTPDHRDSWVDIAGYVGVYDKFGPGGH